MGVFAFLSCKKETKRCYLCRINISVTRGNTTSGGSYSTTTYCDKTEKEIIKIEEDGTKDATVSSNGVTVTQHTLVQCSEQQ
ncbi:hypothetical protein [Mucilaginibacter koreensis]